MNNSKPKSINTLLVHRGAARRSCLRQEQRWRHEDERFDLERCR